MKTDILGMVDGKILVSTPDMDQALLDTFDKMIDEDSEIVMSLCTAKKVIKNKAQALAEKLEEAHEGIEVEIFQETNQFIHTSLVLNNIEIII